MHCAAGKDRTGIFCALAQYLAGVDRDAINDDYLMTNTAVDYDQVVPEVADAIEANYGRRIPPAEMKLFLGVDADYLDQAMGVIGDPRSYVREELGLSDDEISNIERRLLVP